MNQIPLTLAQPAKKIGNYKRCPSCDEKLLAAAVKCPKCKTNLRRYKAKNTCKDCPTEISSTAERCKRCYNSNRIVHRAAQRAAKQERAANDLSIKQAAEQAKRVAAEAQRVADAAEQAYAEQKARRTEEAIERAAARQAKREARRAAARSSSKSTKTCFYFLQSQENPEQWEKVGHTIKDPSLYTDNRIVVSIKDKQYRLDVLVHNISAEALQAGLEAVKLSVGLDKRPTLS